MWYFSILSDASKYEYILWTAYSFQTGFAVCISCECKLQKYGLLTDYVIVSFHHPIKFLIDSLVLCNGPFFPYRFHS